MERLRGDHWFYGPTREVYGAPEELNLDYESIFFESHGERLHGWFFPANLVAACDGPTEPKGTVIHCHGNGGNITGHFRYVTWMPSRGWNVFVFDYRGFGQSTGHPSRPGTVADTHAAVGYAASRGDVDPGRLVLFGQSLGGAVGIVAASQRDDLRAVAIEGAFSSYRREASFVCKQHVLLWGVAPLARLLVAEGLDAIDYVGGIAPTPTFFITGTADRICDYRQTLDLHAAAGEPKSLWVIEDGSHTCALADTDEDDEGMRRLDEFFTRWVTD